MSIILKININLLHEGINIDMINNENVRINNICLNVNFYDAVKLLKKNKLDHVYDILNMVLTRYFVYNF